MRHYFSKPKAEFYVEEYPLVISGLTVFDPDPTPFNTGLLDSDGVPIMVQEIMDQIGYVRR